MDASQLFLMNYRPEPGERSMILPIMAEDVSRQYPPIGSLTDFEPKYSGPVVALGRAVYETQPQESTDHLVRLAVELGRLYAPGNLWVIPTHERLPYPYAVYWPLCNAFQTERQSGRRFDWFVWMDDDVFVTISDWKALMAAVDAEKRPFVAALGYDRLPHHRPAVSEIINGEHRMWFKAPKSGTHPVCTTGLVFAAFHRSLFDKVPEPWFGVAPPIRGSTGINPDWWWSYRLNAAGITPYVCCDTNVIHQGRKTYVDRGYSEKYLTLMADKMEGEYLKQQTVSEATGAITIPPAIVLDGRQV